KPARKATVRKTATPKPKAAASAPNADAAPAANIAPIAQSEDPSPPTAVTGTPDDTPPAA
ncbi:MAG: hypothetical protein ACLGHK_10795, partial [Alphaproteobacteria bacterium]